MGPTHHFPAFAQWVGPFTPSHHGIIGGSFLSPDDGSGSRKGSKMTEAIKNARKKLRTAEAAKYVGLGLSTIEKLRVFGGGPAYFKLGKSVVYDPDDLDAWMASNRRTSTSVAA